MLFKHEGVSIPFSRQSRAVMRTLSIPAAACRLSGYLEDRFCSLSARKGTPSADRDRCRCKTFCFGPRSLSLTFAFSPAPSADPSISFSRIAVNYAVVSAPEISTPSPFKDQKRSQRSTFRTRRIPRGRWKGFRVFGANALVKGSRFWRAGPS